MHFCLRNTAWLNVWFLVFLCLAGPLFAGDPQPSLSPANSADASGETPAPGTTSSLSSWLAAVAPIQAAAPMGEQQQKQLFASLLDHMRVHVSARLLDQLAQRPVEREFPVEDTILGVSFTGRAHSTSSMRVALAPDDERAVFDVILTGVARSHTKGKAGPVCLHCQGVTRFTASKRFHVSDDGVTSLPVKCTAETHSTVTDISSEWSGLRGRIAVRLAWRRSDHTHAEAERISSQHNEEHIARMFDEQMTALAERAETLLAHELLRGGSHDHPERRKFHFHTSRDHVCMASVCSEPRGPLPPEPKADALAQLWLPTAVIDLPLALTALQTARAKPPEQLWRELTGREMAPLSLSGSVASGSEQPPMAVNVAVESGWLGLSMQPR